MRWYQMRNLCFSSTSYSLIYIPTDLAKILMQLCSSLSSVKAYHIPSKLICMIWYGWFFSTASCLSFLFMMKKFPLYSLFYICMFVVCILLKGYPRDWNLYISCIFSHPPLAQGLIFHRTALSCTTIEFKEIAKSSIF